MPKSYLCLDDLAKKKIKKNFQKKDIIKPIDYAQEKLMTLIVLENQLEAKDYYIFVRYFIFANDMNSFKNVSAP